MGFFSLICNVFSAIQTFFTFIYRLIQTPQLDYSNNNNFYVKRDNFVRTYRSIDDNDRRKSFDAVPTDNSDGWLKMTKLEEFTMPPSIFAIERNENDSADHIGMIDEWIAQKSKFRLSDDLYINAYKTMVFFEEAAETLTMESYNLTDITLNQIVAIDRIEFYFNVTPNSDEFFAAIDDRKLNQFILKTKGKKNETFLNGKVIRRVSEKIFVDIFKKDYFKSGDVYDIIFKVNRMNLQLQHTALKYVERHKLFPVLINNPLYHHTQSHSSQSVQSSTDIRFQSTASQNELNPEQMQAIERIVNGTYNPVPYLLYGPPGTGKTKTIVAAIERIVRTTSARILVCAQSNAACNEIAERLTKVLTPREMLRWFSKSHDTNEISATIKPFCNLFDGELLYPSIRKLYKYRVLICTLSTSGCLVRARRMLDFNARHFGFVFIDECASAHETMALIPIAGLCTSVGKVHANIVLSGDPKQLDAVTKSSWSTELGFKTSWFEQLFNLAMYKRNTVTGRFNQNYITQLVRNYRSHRAILKVPNELFYENTLESVVTPDLVRLEMDGLSCDTFPVIFKSVHGYCKRDDDDPSSYNMDEVYAVMELIEELLQPDKYQISQSDIGVVSPYKRQCSTLRKQCGNRGFKDITMGSAETFQGQERKVIIISTVRSGWKLGMFLMNPQRFNVMLTRAKSLLVVVGNPHVLSQDTNWATFIRYCFENGCMIQDNKYFRPRDIR